MHTPVFFEEVITALGVKEGGKYIDATFGEGGYSREILKLGGRVLGIEWDENQYQKSKIKYQKYISKIKNLKLKHGNFKDIERIAKENNFYPVDGIIFDLGLSMEQINNSGRGFSYKRLEEPLDMRISNTLKKTAADIINSYSAQALYEIFSRNSEEINSWAIAKAIISARRLRKIITVKDLVEIISSFKKAIGKKESVLKRVFQALRIEVNNEFNNLKYGLKGGFNILNKGGKIVVITFHSLEDRIVKQFIQKNNFRFILKKPIINRPRKKFERSARIRIFGL